MNELRHALDSYETMLSTAQHVHDNEKVALCKNYIGATLRLMGRWKESYDCQIESISLARLLSNKLPLCVALSNLGALCSEMGRYSEALFYLDESLAIANSTGNELRMASAEGSIGKVYLARGEWDMAEEHFRKALLAGQSSARHQMCSYTSLVLTECSRGNFEEASKHFTQAESFSQQLINAFSGAKADLVSHQTLDDGSFSIEEDLKRRRDLLVLELAGAQLDRLRSRGKEALIRSKRALDTAQAIAYKYGEICALLEMCWSAWSAEEASLGSSSAEQAVQFAQQIGARQLEGEAMHASAFMKYELGDKTDFLPMYQKSIEILESVGDRHGAARACLNFGVHLLHLNHDHEAILNIMRGLQTLVSMRKTALSYETADWLLTALHSAASGLYNQYSNELTELTRAERDENRSIEETDVRRSVQDAMDLRKAANNIFTSSRIVSHSADLALKLAPTEQRLAHGLTVVRENVSNIMGVAEDQRQAVDHHIARLENKLSEFDTVRKIRQTIALEFLQVTLSGVGVTTLYQAILQGSVKQLIPLDLYFILGTAAVWILAPVCFYQQRRFSWKTPYRVLAFISLSIGIGISLWYLARRTLIP